MDLFVYFHTSTYTILLYYYNIIYIHTSAHTIIDMIIFIVLVDSFID